MRPRGGSAVMAGRKEPHDSLDFFPTQPWATRAFCEHVLPVFEPQRRYGGTPLTAWEPGCGEGHMAGPLQEHFDRVYASDVFDYGFGERADFLWPTTAPPFPVDWVISNPPFKLAEQFIARGLEFARRGVAMFVRAQFLEGVGRYRRLYSLKRPSVAYFTERVPLVKGRVDGKARSATAYVWVIFSDSIEPRPLWIPPCRKRLERDEDYQAAT